MQQGVVPDYADVIHEDVNHDTGCPLAITILIADSLDCAWGFITSHEIDLIEWKYTSSEEECSAWLSPCFLRTQITKVDYLHLDFGKECVEIRHGYSLI